MQICYRQRAHETPSETRQLWAFHYPPKRAQLLYTSHQERTNQAHKGVSFQAPRILPSITAEPSATKIWWCATESEYRHAIQAPQSHPTRGVLDSIFSPLAAKSECTCFVLQPYLSRSRTLYDACRLPTLLGRHSEYVPYRTPHT